MLERFELITAPKPGFTVSSRFLIRPFITELLLPEEIYILKLTKKGVGLVRCSHLRVEPISLPADAPGSVDEFLAFKPPDHDLENRFHIGVSAGSLQSIRFGTGTARESQHTYLSDFHKAVNRCLTTFLQANLAPLILAGVDEETAAYRAVSDYPGLMHQSIHGSPGEFTDLDLMETAYRIVQSEGVERAAEALVLSREELSPERVSSKLRSILRAAVKGRVDSLYLNDNAQMEGFYPPSDGTNFPGLEREDLLNVAAIETILHGGTVFNLPGQRIPEEAPAFAFLRY